MNEMSGVEFQERLVVPIVFITSHDDAATRVRIEKPGAAGHLWKPFEEPAVLSVIRRAVGPTPHRRIPVAALTVSCLHVCGADGPRCSQACAC